MTFSVIIGGNKGPARKSKAAISVVAAPATPRAQSYFRPIANWIGYDLEDMVLELYNNVKAAYHELYGVDRYTIRYRSVNGFESCIEFDANHWTEAEVDAFLAVLDARQTQAA